jgi:hypothetical protein
MAERVEPTAAPIVVPQAAERELIFLGLPLATRIESSSLV